ncbi:UNKNOWN [Stylonychia lemnae]|uniref:Tpr domain containing protein n=1 Tax=Stylonychia lemnae TaxID=5949 RepID=A0A078A6F0_STYLE|nr:UNKNOWN [Stylonychia lemnae]|eukprot:CDW77840.1 UNKNOWN [Stylonychia lemnae]
MSNFNQFNSQSQNTSDQFREGTCPVLSSLHLLPEERKNEMLKQYDEMVKSGMHKPLPSQNAQVQLQCPAQMKQEMITAVSTRSSSADENSKQQLKSQLISNTEKKPIMGCPFFSKEITDPQGKNITQGYPLKYISKLDYLFSPQTPKQIREFKLESCEFLNSLPYVVKHSLFLDLDMMSKMRELADIGQLFFITDDTKIKGNKFYDQGKYYEALDVYEQVLGCYIWLDFIEEGFSDKLFHDLKGDYITDKDVDFKERRIIRESDREIESETTYMSLFHFDEAMKCADLILDNYIKDPEIYFRKSQVIYFDKTSTIQRLQDALELVDKECLQSNKPQKQMMKYQELYDKIQKEIDDRIVNELKIASLMLKRAQKLLEAQKLQKVKAMKTVTIEENEMYQVMYIMDEKYPELIQFFRDNDNQAQLQKGINEHQYFSSVFKQIEFALMIDMNNLNSQIKDRLDQQNLDVLNNPKLSTIIEEVKLEIADSIFFHSNDLNQEVYNYAWRIYQEKKEKMDKFKTKKSKAKQGSDSYGHDCNEKKRSLAESMLDPNKATIMNLGLFFLLGIILFYFGWGFEWINERHITKWLRAYFQHIKTSK